MDAPTAVSAPTTTNIPVDMSTTTASNLRTETTAHAAAPTAHCEVCRQMQSRLPMLKQSGLSKKCVLCLRPYCIEHAAKADEAAGEDVCEINHRTYHRKHRQRWAEGIFPTLAAREARGLAVTL